MLRICKRIVLNEVGNVKTLGCVALEKFAASGNIEEELTHLNFRSAGPCNIADRYQFAAVEFDFSTLSISRCFGPQEESRNRCNRRKGFAAKTERRNRFEIICGSEFRSCVSFEGDDCLVASHAFTIVQQANQTFTARFDFYVDF